MSTQGLVSVMGSGKVVAKIVAGCGGYNAPALAELLSGESDCNARDLAQLAAFVGFGCSECRVAMVSGEDGRVLALGPQGAGELNRLYVNTFSDPRFNPRWARGTVPYLEIVGQTHGASE